MKIKFSEFHLLLAAGIMILVSGTAFLYWICKLENLPTFFVAVIAIGLSYLSYINARDKVRLELFEKRYEAYQNCLSFCSTILSYGNVPDAKKFIEERQKFEAAANKSFRGDGFHLSSFLFGPDIKMLFEELNTMYAYLSTYTTDTLKEIDQDKLLEVQEQKRKYIWRAWIIVNELPNIFSKYFDMTDYVKNSFSFEFDFAKKSKSSQKT